MLYGSAIGRDGMKTAQHRLYQITPDGAARRWWSDDQSLSMNRPDGGLVVATDGGACFMNAQGRPGLRTQDETFCTGRMLRTTDGRSTCSAHSGRSSDSARPGRRLLRVAR